MSSHRHHDHHRQHNRHRESELNYNDFRHGMIDSLDTDYAQKRRRRHSNHNRDDRYSRSRSEGSSRSLSYADDRGGGAGDNSEYSEYSDDDYYDSGGGGDTYDRRDGHRRRGRRRNHDYSGDESDSYYDDGSEYDSGNDDDYGDEDDYYGYDQYDEEEEDEEDGDMSGDVKIIVPNRDVYDDFISHAGVMLAEFIASSIQSDIAIQRKATNDGNGSAGEKSQSAMLERAVKKFCSLLIDFPQSVSDGLRREFAARLGDGYQTHSIVQQFMPALQYAASILRDHNDKFMHIPYNVSYGMGNGGANMLEYIVHRPDDYRSSLRYSSSLSSSSTADAISIELFIIDSLRRLVQTTLTSVSARNVAPASNSANHASSSRAEPRVIHVDLFTSQNYSRLLESVKSSMRAVLTEYASRYTFLAPVWWKQLDHPSSSIAANVASTKFLGASAQQARLSYMAHDRQQIAKDTRHDTHAIARSMKRLRHKMSRDRRSGRHSMESMKKWYKHQASRTIRRAADKAARSVQRRQQQNDSSIFHPNNGQGGYYDRHGYFHDDYDYDGGGRRSRSRRGRHSRSRRGRRHKSRYDRNGRKIVYVYQNQQQQQSQNPNMSQQQFNNGDASYNPGNGNGNNGTYVGNDGNTYYCNTQQQQQVDSNGNILWSPDDGHRRHRHRKHKHRKHRSSSSKKKRRQKKKKNNNRKRKTTRRRSSKSKKDASSSSSPSSSSYYSNPSSYFSSAGSYSNPSDSYSSSVFTD